MKDFTTVFIFFEILTLIQGYKQPQLTEWTANINGGKDDALMLAKRYALQFRGQVSIGRKHGSLYRFAAKGLSQDGERRISQHLENEPKVLWVYRQDALERERKYVIPGLQSAWIREDEERVLSRQKRNHIDVNCMCKNVSNFPNEKFGEYVYEVLDRQSDPSLAHMFDDPKWPCQWELYNCGQTSGPHRVDLNVVPCWEKGFTGKGVVVSVVDDGLDYNNADLKHAYDERASTDLNENYDRDGPLPDKVSSGNDHGTKCGGEISMQPNNNYCGVGVAYDASVGGIRFLDGVVTDTSEAAALVFNADYVNIYSCSWGPQDNGRTWEGPGNLAAAALEVGALEGRGGLGSIYVWAAGNGGAANDHCGADGYTCNIYTIGIASVSDQGLSTFYTEPCPCIMAVTLNGGPHHMPDSVEGYRPLHYLVTTDPYKGCVNTFSGTSSAAPLASGVVALMLQANPRLTWRDVQHIIARNSKIPNPTEDGWNVNGAGLHVHHKYGFGLMDAAKLVMAAQSWINVEEQHQCEVQFPNANRSVRSGGSAVFNGHTNACSKSSNRVQKLEHVQVIMSYSAPCRGDVSIEVISPCGTRSELLGTRSLDDNYANVENWAFMTVHNWGEDPRGVWQIKISDNKGTVTSCRQRNHEIYSIAIKDIRLVFWGTGGPQWKEPSCIRKEDLAEEAMEEANVDDSQKPLIIDPKAPLDRDERLEKEIIDAEFLGENDNVITENDLQFPEKSKDQKRIEEKRKPSDVNVRDVSQRLLAYLESNPGYDKEEEYRRAHIPLHRTTRKRED